jgi:hypothetical protein
MSCADFPPDDMKIIKLSGREMAVLKAIDFSTGTPGQEVIERTNLPLDDLTAVVNGLMEVGYVETNPPMEMVTEELLSQVLLDVNPGYVHDLRAAMRRQ